MVYHGVKDGERAVDVFSVTRRTRKIQGVTCRVVHDRLRLAGVLVERTFDWYAQSRSGDVWYFGERTAELGPHGRVLTTSARVRVPLVRSSHALLTKEWTPLEPHVVDHKYYVRDVGVVSEQSVSGPRETGRLVSITHMG
ncbi:MAG TPA: hypothetical protein VFJ09_14695 [Nocardioidaceae bacterium]|nr:hypothetical protein [Nocardioidaceae bacterium]